ncbi:MAG: hypothetical protein LBF60_05880, partial [Treponema sp.]|jgi:hypothetical protein|nr:hypothetical protein [Treponema sp.]
MVYTIFMSDFHMTFILAHIKKDFKDIQRNFNIFVQKKLREAKNIIGGPHGGYTRRHQGHRLRYAA